METCRAAAAAAHVVGVCLLLLLAAAAPSTTAASTCGGPEVAVVNRTLMFLVEAGRRVGYQQGDAAPVYFEDLASTSSLVGSAYLSGQAAGKANCSARSTADAASRELDLLGRIHAAEVRLSVVENVTRLEADSRFDGDEQLGLRIATEKTASAAAVVAETQARTTAVAAEAAARASDVSSLAGQLQAQATRIALLEGQVSSLDATVTTLVGSAATSGGGVAGETTYWLSMRVVGGLRDAQNRVYAALFKANVVELFGVGFDKLYHPNAGDVVDCSFNATSAGAGTAPTITAGTVKLAGSLYHIECPTPSVTARGSTFEVTAGLGISIPFVGPDSRNVLRFDQSWASATSAQKVITVLAYGLDPTAAYTVTLTGSAGATRTLAATSVSATAVTVAYDPVALRSVFANAGGVAKVTLSVQTAAGATVPPAAGNLAKMDLGLLPDGSVGAPFTSLQEVEQVDPGEGYYHFVVGGAGVRHFFYKDAGNRYWVMVASITDTTNHGPQTGGQNFWKGKWRTADTTGTPDNARGADYRSTLYSSLQAKDLLVMQGFVRSGTSTNFAATSSEIAMLPGVFTNRGGNFANLFKSHVSLANHGSVGGTVIPGMTFIKGSAAAGRSRLKPSSNSETRPDNVLHLAPANCEGYTYAMVNTLGNRVVGCNVEHHTWVGDETTNYSERNYPEPGWDTTWGITVGSNYMYWLILYR